MDDLKNELAQNGLKATNGRLAVLRYLRETKGHPTAAMVKEKLMESGIYASTATIYNILNDFSSRRMIRRIGEFEGCARFDYDTTDHIHICNSEKGTVEDYNGNEIVEEVKRRMTENGIETKTIDLMIVI